MWWWKEMGWDDQHRESRWAKLDSLEVCAVVARTCVLLDRKVACDNHIRRCLWPWLRTIAMSQWRALSRLRLCRDRLRRYKTLAQWSLQAMLEWLSGRQPMIIRTCRMHWYSSMWSMKQTLHRRRSLCKTEEDSLKLSETSSKFYSLKSLSNIIRLHQFTLI